jgi:two-component system, OmpR family, sensor histidine kinase KdpD
MNVNMSATSPRRGPAQRSESGTDVPTADFIAAVSHELRQPLASIRGLTEMLLGHWGDFSDQDKTEMLREVLHEAERVGHLVDELLDFSRMGSGQLRLRWMETDLGKIVARAMSNLALSFPLVGVTVELPPGFPTIMADPFKIEQVLFNLLENSCQHGSAGAVRVVVARKREPRAEVVEISVADNGVGIAPEDLPRVTEKFFRATARAPGGLGLGLWISREIVEAHGGVLLATSVPGEGTTVRFTIPLRESTGAGKLAGI